MQDTSARLTERLGEDGYAFAKVNPITELDEEKGEVAINFFIDPGQRVYVRRIEIVGNTSTQDEVLRRELRQIEGGWLSPPAAGEVAPPAAAAGVHRGGGDRAGAGARHRGPGRPEGGRDRAPGRQLLHRRGLQQRQRPDPGDRHRAGELPRQRQPRRLPLQQQRHRPPLLVRFLQSVLHHQRRQPRLRHQHPPGRHQRQQQPHRIQVARLPGLPELRHPDLGRQLLQLHHPRAAHQPGFLRRLHAGGVRVPARPRRRVPRERGRHGRGRADAVVLQGALQQRGGRRRVPLRHPRPQLFTRDGSLREVSAQTTCRSAISSTTR